MGFGDVYGGFIHVKTTKCSITFNWNHNYMAISLPLKMGIFYLMRSNSIDLNLL